MAGENTVSTLNGKFRERYAPRLENALPRGVPFQEDVAFAKAAQQIGNQFHQPVVLSFEHGLTYSAASGGAFALNTQVAANLKDATVVGAQIAIASAIDVESLARGLDDGRAYSPDTMELVLGNMKDAIGKHVEMSHLWGGAGQTNSGWGKITGGTTGRTGARTYVIDLAAWSPAIWAGSVGMPIRFIDDDGSGGIPGTALGSADDAAITAVALSTRTITVSGTEADLDAVDTAANAGSVYVYPKGAKGAQWLGLNELAASTGTLFGIDGATYEGFTGNTYPVGSLPLSLQKIMDGLDSAVGRGLDEDVKVYVNHRAWTDIMLDQAALRVFDASYDPKEAKNGAKSLKFFYQSGQVEVKTHRFMKEGNAIAFAPRWVQRLGATDITFKVPGTSEQFLFHLPSNMGIGLRGYTMQATFTAMPAKLTLYTGIVNG